MRRNDYAKTCKTCEHYKKDATSDVGFCELTKRCVIGNRCFCPRYKKIANEA